MRAVLRAAQDLAGKVAAQTQDQLRGLGYDSGVTGTTAGPEEYLLRLITTTMDDYRKMAETGTPPTSPPALLPLIIQVAG
jgi:hypothetical protein